MSRVATVVGLSMLLSPTTADALHTATNTMYPEVLLL